MNEGGVESFEVALPSSGTLDQGLFCLAWTLETSNQPLRVNSHMTPVA